MNVEKYHDRTSMLNNVDFAFSSKRVRIKQHIFGLGFTIYADSSRQNMEELLDLDSLDDFILTGKIKGK